MPLGTIALLSLAGSTTHAAVVPGEVVLREGDMPAGLVSTVTNVRAPFVEPDGTVGFTGSLANDDQFVFRGSQVLWLNTDVMGAVATGAEVSMGTSSAMGFIYSPALDGLDAVYTHEGPLLVEGDPAPGYPVGAVSTFHSRPTMTANGAAWWIMGVDETGSGATEQRALVRSGSATSVDAFPWLRTGDLVGGIAIDSPTGLDFDYQLSHDEQHLIAVVNRDTGTTLDDGTVYVDGLVVAVEDGPNGQGDSWDNFDLVTINANGHFAFSGDTNGPIGSDEFVAYDGAIVFREGDLVGGLTLGTTAAVRFIALDDNDRLVHAWSHSGGVETVFLSCNPSDPGTTQAILSTGDELDTDGDGLGDGIFVDDILPTTGTPGRAMGNDGSIYVEVDIVDGVVLEAMIRLPVRCCGNGVVDPGESCDDGNILPGDGCSPTCQGALCGNGVVDPGEACDDGNLLPGDDCLNDCTAASCGDGVLWIGVEGCDAVDGDDTDECLDTCALATCGDGVVWAGVESCDDGNLDDTDDCTASCQLAACGDGVVWAGIEECDDGNLDETDDCLSSCLLASCGDGQLQAGVESCDDGNFDDTDACPSTCEPAACGDGFVWAGVEMCDDGNLEDDDDCPSTCAPASCGDGFVQDGVEECDDGNMVQTDDCLDTCVLAFCGDGIVRDFVETCDDGNDIDTDACPSTCLEAFCGDGFIQEGVEECDDENLDDTDACTTECVAAVCGDGIVWVDDEECDDGNRIDDDACSNDCTVPAPDPDTSGGPTDDTTGGGGSSGGGPGTTGGEGSDTGTAAGTETDGDTTGAVDDGGCGCTTDGRGTGPRGWLVLLGLVAIGRRRRSSRATP